MDGYNYASAGAQLNESSIVSALEDIRDAVQPTNPCLDIDIFLNATGWSGSGPYTYTYSNEHITSGCEVKANFLESANAPRVYYLEYEKVTGGIRFTSNSVPDYAIPVRLHILNADATSTTATTADAVSTNAISGTSNVEDALTSVGEDLATLNGKIDTFVKSKTFSITTDATGCADINTNNLGYARNQCLILAVLANIATGDTVYPIVGVYRASTVSWTIKFQQGNSAVASQTFNITVWYVLL